MAGKRNNYKEDQYYERRPEKKSFNFFGFLAIVFMAGGAFYLFTIVMPKIGGQKFDVEKTMSIVDVVKDKTTDDSQEEKQQKEELSNSKEDFGATKAIKDGENVLETGKKAGTSFLDKIKDKFNKKELKDTTSDKPKQPNEKKQDIKQPNEKKQEDQRVIVDDKLAAKNQKNNKGEIVNDLSYYEK